MNRTSLRSVLLLASPLLAGLAALCSETATGPERLERGTFRLSVTGDAAVDTRVDGTSRAAATLVDTLEDGRPVLRFSLDLEDAETGLGLAARFLAEGRATGRLGIRGAGDTLSAVDSLEAGTALTALDPGSLLDRPVSVQSGALEITTDTERELAGRIELLAVPLLGPDSLGTGSLHLSGEFRAPR